MTVGRAMRSLSHLAVVFCCVGCIGPEARLDAGLRWQQAESGLASALRSLEEIRLLRNDYEAVVFLDRSGTLRGRAYQRLAELDLAQHEYASARENLINALRADLNPSGQRKAFLLLGDLLQRDPERRTQARSVYEQLIREHPGTDAAELAALRMEALSR